MKENLVFKGRKDKGHSIPWFTKMQSIRKKMQPRRTEQAKNVIVVLHMMNKVFNKNMGQKNDN